MTTKLSDFPIHTLSIILLAAMMFVSNAALSAEKKDKAARRNALMMQKMKQEFEQEKINLQAQFDAERKKLQEDLKKSVDDLAVNEKKLKETTVKLSKTSKQLATLQTEHEATKLSLENKTKEFEISQKNLSDLKKQHDQALADLKFNDGQRKTLASNLAQTTKSLNTCEEKNNQLYRTGKEIIQIYDTPSRYEAIMREEPILQLKRVELENILQGKLDKLDEAKVYKER